MRSKTGWNAWSDDEKALLQRFYQEKGAAWCAERLGRSMSSIYHGADRYVTRKEDNPKRRRLLSITEAEILTDTDARNVRRAARREGVAVEMSLGVLVPLDWAKKFKARVQRWRANEALGWYRVNDIHRIFRISRSSHMTVRRWFDGYGRYGFAFAERVEMRPGRPTGRTLDGGVANARLFNPWDVNALNRDILAKEPILTPRCGLFIAHLHAGHEPIWKPRGPTGYYFEMHDESGGRCVGLFPQAIGTWLRRTGVIRRTRDQYAIELTEKGRSLADDLLETGSWPVLGSAA